MCHGHGHHSSQNTLAFVLASTSKELDGTTAVLFLSLSNTNIAIAGRPIMYKKTIGNITKDIMNRCAVS